MKNVLTASIVTILLYACSAGKKTVTTQPELTRETVPYFVSEAAGQYKRMMKVLPAGRFPKSYDRKTDKLVTSGSEWWCSGFYPGTLLNLYKETNDTALLTEASRMLRLLEKEKTNKGTHDLGFMMYCSFGNALELDPNANYQEVLLTSAKSLTTRFNPKVGCIRSWDSKSEFIVIIDNMMNLELLFWAFKNSGDSSYYKTAVTHANTTLANHFRPDNSSYHLVIYDEQTGNVKSKRTAQGAADESAWTRGQAWGLYGYTVMFRETRDAKYLEQAQKIADFMLNHPNLPADKIPYWDYNAPGIPDTFRDASAAAILASALLELEKYSANKSDQYYNSAVQILKTLSSAPYKSLTGSNAGFILDHGVGHLPQKSEVDVPLTYADYYYVEALRRYKEGRR